VRLALYQPDIPQNAGTMMRMAACLGVGVDLIEPAGFDASDRNLRRAGLDYLAHLDIARHASFALFDEARRAAGHRLILGTTQADMAVWDFAFGADDILMVGRETVGVPPEVHAGVDARLGIPMQAGLRSLNVAVAAAMMLGEAVRQVRR
jgi:tRNA (cytidine/uridine-2'-O-)-methyltransferase